MDPSALTSSRNLEHLKSHLVSLDPTRLVGITGYLRHKVEAAQIRHAELRQQLHDLEREHEAAENPHLQHYFKQHIEVLLPQIRHAFDTIRPYTYRGT